MCATTIKYKVSNDELTEYKQKMISRRLTQEMVKKGEIERATHCQKCGIKYKTIAHHLDYGKPDQVMWLCMKCHGVVHRKGHELNPDSIKQTSLPVRWAEKDYVKVNFEIPVENFIYIKKLCQERGINFSKLLRGCILERFPVDDDQLEFNFGGNKNHESNEKEQQRIQSMEHDQQRLFESRQPQVSELWNAGHDLGEGVGKVRNFPKGHGDYARRMQWPGVDRQDNRAVL